MTDQALLTASQVAEHPSPLVTSVITETVRRAHQRGERWTAQRSVVVRVLAEATEHLSADAVVSRVQTADPRIGQATVYRTLNCLVALGVVERLIFGDGRAKFEIVLGREHHDHLIDADTGETMEFHDPEIERLQQEIARRLGYDLTDHRLVLFGRKRPAT